MSKHTPGKWVVIQREVMEDGSVYPMHVVGGAAELQICLMESLTIARMRVDDPKMLDSFSASYSDANARLIAAAPDLLAACQAMAEWDAAENQLPPYDSDNGASFDQCMALCRDAFDKARAAIAKATGEQS